MDESSISGYSTYRSSIRNVNRTRIMKIKVKKSIPSEFLIDGMFICSLDPESVTHDELRNKDYWKGRKKMKRSVNFRLFLKKENNRLADEALSLIFPDNIGITPVQPKSDKTEDFLNE